MPTSAEVIDSQKKDWNRVAPAWEKWDRLIDENLSFINYRLVGEARIRTGFEILDLGSGTGYPALLAAEAAGTTGRVTGIDLAEEMLDVARRKAKRLNLSNIVFQCADISTLAFPDHRFDSVISRFCLMFLPDVPKAVREIYRVLKPGGYLSAVVWSNPDKNPFLRLATDVIKNYVSIPPPDPNQPGVFRLAKAGELSGMLEESGFTEIVDVEMGGESRYASAEEYLSNVKEMAAPLQGLFAKLMPGDRDRAESEIKDSALKYQRDGMIPIPLVVRVVTGRKPV